MEAARIPWRPLGRILVEQGLLTSEELETALEQQERTGKRLGETIVECGFVSGPELSNALASQYGIELTTETGFGTGLRTEIQRRHESERRGSRPGLVAAHLEAVPDEPEPDDAEEHSAEASLLTQLEEQWAKLAAAEALIAEHRQEVALLAAQRDRRREQAARLARRARGRAASPESDPDLREELDRLATDLHGQREERNRLEHETRHLHERLAVAEASLQERDGELGEARDALAAARTALEEENRRLEELGAEFERVVQSRTETEAALGDARRSLSEREADLEASRAELDEARHAVTAATSASEEQERRLEELAEELERVVHSRNEVEHALADARANLEEHERDLGELRERLAQGHDSELAPLRAELERAHEALATAEAAREEQERRLAELGTEFERVVHSRTEVEHALADARATLEAREQGDEAQFASLRAELAEAQGALVEAEAARVQHERRLEELGAELDRVVHARAEESDRALDDLRRRLDADHEAELAQLRHELAGKVERRRAQAVRLAKRLRSLRLLDEQQLSQIERLVADVRGCDAEIERLRQENGRARAQARRFLDRVRRERDRAGVHAPEPEPESAPEIASHLVFVELPDRYVLVERAGPPPERHTPIELPELDRQLVVAGARRSPLPNDSRPCVVAQAPVFAASQ